MNKNLLNMLAAVLVVGMSGTAHAIPVVWTLDGTIFQGGTASGSFVYDADISIFSSISLVTSADAPSGGLTFTDYVGESSGNLYFHQAGVSPGDATVGLSLQDITESLLTNAGGVLPINIDPSSSHFAEFNCTAPCTGSGGNVSNWNANGVSTLTGIPRTPSGNVPEPATLALMGLGMIGLGFRRKSVK